MEIQPGCPLLLTDLLTQEDDKFYWEAVVACNGECSEHNDFGILIGTAYPIIGPLEMAKKIRDALNRDAIQEIRRDQCPYFVEEANL